MPYGEVTRAVLKLIQTLTDRIVETGRKDEEADKGGDKPPPSKRHRRYRHPTDGEHRVAEQFQWRRSNIVSYFTFLAAAGAVIFAIKTWQQTKRQADISQRALSESQAPEVQIAGVRVSADVGPANQIVGFTLTPQWKNAGAGGTRGLHWVTFCGVQPPNYDPWMHIPPLNDSAPLQFLAPGQTLGGGYCPLPLGGIATVDTGASKFFILGSVRYRGREDKITVHVTEFSYITDHIDQQGSTVSMNSQSVDSHNCEDEDCPGYTGK